MQKNFGWLFYVILAGLAWGTYVPIVFYGGRELTTERGTLGGRLTSILCVGMAYFVLAVLIPLVLFLTKQHLYALDVMLQRFVLQRNPLTRYVVCNIN